MGGHRPSVQRGCPRHASPWRFRGCARSWNAVVKNRRAAIEPGNSGYQEVATGNAVGDDAACQQKGGVENALHDNGKVLLGLVYMRDRHLTLRAQLARGQPHRNSDRIDNDHVRRQLAHQRANPGHPADCVNHECGQRSRTKNRLAKHRERDITHKRSAFDEQADERSRARQTYGDVPAGLDEGRDCLEHLPIGAVEIRGGMGNEGQAGVVAT